jgi:hypothetical protein
MARILGMVAATVARMRNLWMLMVLGACVDADVESVEQHITETYDVCAKGTCTKCWIDTGDKNREKCEKPVDFKTHAGLAKTELVFESATHEVALWSLKNGWRTLSPTEVAGDALGIADYDGNGSFEISITTIACDVKSPRDSASGLATGRRLHKPLTLTMELGGRGDVDGDGATDVVWTDAQGQAEISFIKRDQTEVVDPTRALPGFTLVGIGDFDGTKTADLVWRDGAKLRIRSMAGAKITAEREESVDPTWAFVGAADLDKDRRAEILWREASGGLVVWPSGSPSKAFKQTLDPRLRIEALHDLDSDGIPDLLLRDNVTKKSSVYVLRGVVWTYTNGGVTHEDTWNAQT